MLLLTGVPALVHALAVIRPRGTGVRLHRNSAVAMTTTVNPSIIGGRQ